MYDKQMCLNILFTEHEYYEEVDCPITEPSEVKFVY